MKVINIANRGERWDRLGDFMAVTISVFTRTNEQTPYRLILQKLARAPDFAALADGRTLFRARSFPQKAAVCVILNRKLDSRRRSSVGAIGFAPIFLTAIPIVISPKPWKVIQNESGWR